MEDVTDPAFRLLCKEMGADLVYSEFVSADALVRSVNRSLQKIQVRDEERPAAVQLYGRDVPTMVEAALIVEEQAHPDIIDLNFGCPVKKIAHKGAGAGMLRNIPLLLQITQAVVQAVHTPVTVKTRLGWDHDHLLFPQLAEQLQDCGIAALTIHGRTRSQMYTGHADWTLIGATKNNPRIRIPIIGNGDIATPEQAKQAFDRWGVDAVMIGRAAIGQPWIFRDMRTFLDTGAHDPLLTKQWQLHTLRRLIAMSVQQSKERNDCPRKATELGGILHVRRHLAASPLFKGIPNFRSTRIKLLQATTLDELNSLLDEIGEMLSEDRPAPQENP